MISEKQPKLKIIPYLGYEKTTERKKLFQDDMDSLVDAGVWNKEWQKIYNKKLYRIFPKYNLNATYKRTIQRKIQCAICKTVFPASTKLAKYCSEKCLNQSRKNGKCKNEYKNMLRKQCQICDVFFYTTDSKRKYCSQKCSNQSGAC